jgi:hypothetical protein
MTQRGRAAAVRGKGVFQVVHLFLSHSGKPLNLQTLFVLLDNVVTDGVMFKGRAPL